MQFIIVIPSLAITCCAISVIGLVKKIRSEVPHVIHEINSIVEKTNIVVKNLDITQENLAELVNASHLTVLKVNEILDKTNLLISTLDTQASVEKVNEILDKTNVLISSLDTQSVNEILTQASTLISTTTKTVQNLDFTRYVSVPMKQLYEIEQTKCGCFGNRK
jgi:ABC-type transporter Mla subunit MlaD